MDKSVMDYIRPPERTGDTTPAKCGVVKTTLWACIAGLTLGAVGLVGWDIYSNNNHDTYYDYLGA